MELVEKLFQVIWFSILFVEYWFEFSIYKYFKRKNIVRNEESINGKCVVITGGSSGIGKSSAMEFAQRGAVVVIGDVDLENGRKAVDKIKRDTGNVNVTILKLDLSDMDSVEQFAQKVSSDHPRIKILLNNAGIGASGSENIKTKDGFNIHVAVNYMGHFLLTNLLMDNLKAETNPRIVSTCSFFQLMSKLNMDDLNMDSTGFGLQNCIPYCNTKFMLALFTKQLEKQNGVKAYALCPGIVNTPIYTNAPLLMKLAVVLSRMLSSSPNKAASEFIMYCALEKSISNESGKMYRLRKHFDRANDRLDSDLARKLCEKSATLVKLSERLVSMSKVNNITKVK